jgi:hypothetical protein
MRLPHQKNSNSVLWSVTNISSRNISAPSSLLIQIICDVLLLCVNYCADHTEEKKSFFPFVNHMQHGRVKKDGAKLTYNGHNLPAEFCGKPVRCFKIHVV